MAERDRKRTACLLGNGVSIAYNPDLAVARLTDALLTRFRAAGATDPGRTLRNFADQVAARGASPVDTFEGLLGPLEWSARGLVSLEGLAPLAEASATDVTAALANVRQFMTQVHRMGLAITLQHIADRSVGSDAYYTVTATLGAALVRLGSAADLTVATLNYDGLLHAALMDAGTDAWGGTIFPIADLADGRSEEAHTVILGHDIPGHPLRDFDSLPSDRASLLQLHGSLGWLRGLDGRPWRFPLTNLREAGYWDAWRRHDTQWEPVVVLTDRKEPAVGTWPFALAYEIFHERLLSADRWLIAGYGFRDIPVNVIYRAAVEQRRRSGLAVPSTLVVDYDGDPLDLIDRVNTTLNIPKSVLTACIAGLPGAFDSTEWQEWAG